MLVGRLVGLICSVAFYDPVAHDGGFLETFWRFWWLPAVYMGGLVFGAILGILIGIWIPKIVIIVTTVIYAAVWAKNVLI